MDHGGNEARAGVETPIALARPILEGNERKYVNECLDTGWLTYKGRFEGEFEKAISERLKSPALVCSSGTGALHLALLSLGIGAGDEVIVPDLTFGTTASVVLAVGAKPVLVDVRRDTFGLDQNRVLGVLNKKTRAIIPVSLFGLDPGDFRQFGIPVIEDAAESFGMVPLRGRVSCFSFFANKVLTTGEGGALVGDFGNAREWRNGGFDEEYRNTLPGLNYRMTNIQAAIGLAQMERCDELLGARLANSEFYGKHLPGKGKWMFCVETKDPIGLIAHLKESGVESRPMFTPLHRSPAFRVYAKGKYKVSDEIWENHVSLPTGPHLKQEEIEKITELVNGFSNLRESHLSNPKLAA